MALRADWTDLSRDSRDMGNVLLAKVPQAERALLFAHLQPIALSLGDVLHEWGDRQDHLYFPAGCVVSLLNVLEDGASTEIAMVGNEGVIGIGLLMGSDTTASRAVVQRSGNAYRLPGSVLKVAFQRDLAVRISMLRYTHALATQIAQSVVCNRHHSIDQQLSRWLLLWLDRLESNVLTMTQQLIANMLGVRREGVTEAALKLQRADIIQYSRGRIIVLDRSRLEDQSCECYRAVRCETSRPGSLSVAGRS